MNEIIFRKLQRRKQKIEGKQADRQTERGGRGKRQAEGKRERKRERFFFFACILGWADLTCLYLPS